MPTIPSLNHVHKVLIKFPKRIPAAGSHLLCPTDLPLLIFRLLGTHVPGAHPSAPPEVKSAFPAFTKKIETSRISPSPTKARHQGQFTYAGFWEAPPRFWNTLPINEAEIEAIEVGAATRSLIVTRFLPW
jgi:small subunit ribosomal protein YMR-31